MKAIKVCHWTNTPMRDIYPHATAWQVFKYRAGNFARKVFIVLSALALVASVAGAVRYMYPLEADAVETIVTVEVQKRLPIQDRIAGCESEGNAKSKGSQFDAKGRVRKHVNKDGSVDIGRNMINDYHWEAKAVELGYNIYTLEGNDKMSDYIFAQSGSAPWAASAKCWNI